MEPHTARLGILLKLNPQELEEQFWNAAETQRMLSIMDILAFCMVLPNMVAAVLGRVNRSLPEHVQLPWGAKAILMLYWALTMLPVAVMLLHLQSYTKWRLRLAVLGRMYRLVGAALLTHPATVLGYVTQVAAVRQAVFAGDTVKALLTNSLLPTVLHMQQSHCFVPFRLAIPFQIGCMAVAVMWAQGMPCWLPLPGPGGLISCSNSKSSVYLAHLPRSALLPPDLKIWAPGNPAAGGAAAAWSYGDHTLDDGLSAAAAWSVGNHTLDDGLSAAAAWLVGDRPLGDSQFAAAAAAAEAFRRTGHTACKGLQSVFDLMWLPVQAPYSFFGSEGDGLCQGAAAFQLLYLFVAAMLLLWVILTSSWFMEYYAKLHWLRLQGIALATSQGPEGPRQGQPPMFLRSWPLCMHIVLPATASWLLSRQLTDWIGGACAPPLGNAAFEWMHQLF